MCVYAHGRVITVSGNRSFLGGLDSTNLDRIRVAPFPRLLWLHRKTGLLINSITVSNLNLCRAFYSAFGLSAKIQRLFDLLKGFTVGTITDSDTDSIDLFRMARTLVNETRDEKVI